ncbi:MAG: hypothetical protein RBU37_08480 [Myxococcota bacterium]|jgi:hypothetical protein|nr:hypothetical protein [Myxococcota bacterium]
MRGHAAALCVLLGLSALACRSTPPVALERAVLQRQALLFAPSGVLPNAAVPLLCVGFEGNCLDALPLDAALSSEGASIPILGKVELSAWSGRCEGANEAVELLEAPTDWLLWPADAGPILKAPGQPSTRPDDERAISLALSAQSVVIPPVRLLGQLDLGGDSTEERVYLVGEPDAAVAVAAVRSDGVALFASRGGVLRFDGFVDLDGDGRYALLLSERSEKAWSFDVLRMSEGKLLTEASWACSL